MSSAPTFWIEARASGMLAFALVMAMVWRALVPPAKPKRKPLAAAETA